jgi:hypothetical protein
MTGMVINKYNVELWLLHQPSEIESGWLGNCSTVSCMQRRGCVCLENNRLHINNNWKWIVVLFELLLVSLEKKKNFLLLLCFLWSMKMCIAQARDRVKVVGHQNQMCAAIACMALSAPNKMRQLQRTLMRSHPFYLGRKLFFPFSEPKTW